MSKTLDQVFSPSLSPDETTYLRGVIDGMGWDTRRANRVRKVALGWVQTVREKGNSFGTLEGFLQQFALTSDEGLALMTLAEALMRIPDAATMNDLISDKMASAAWTSGMESGSAGMKAAGLGLKVTSKTLSSGLSRVGMPVIRKSMMGAMRKMGQQFVLGEDIQEAFIRAAPYEKTGYRMSYDMLGEAALSAEDADVYFKSYRGALRAIGDRNHMADPSDHDVRDVPGISVKLSALYPRYEVAQEAHCVPELADRLLQLAREAARFNIALTVDAEEVERLGLSLKIIDAVAGDESLQGWAGFGVAVQAYQKRALDTVDYVADIARRHGLQMQVRLVKGAYWDREIKHAQELGLAGYPVLTRKSYSDVNYLACAERLFENTDCLYPMFGTHNAHSIAAVMDMAKSAKADFELQRLHGMGDSLYSAVLDGRTGVRVSVYAPVGPQRDLLPYLVRRLLENGANSSFVNQLMDADFDPAFLVQDPVKRALGHDLLPHNQIKLPCDMYADEGAGRVNSRGVDLDDAYQTDALLAAMSEFEGAAYHAYSVVNGAVCKDTLADKNISPSDHLDIIGSVYPARERHVDKAMHFAQMGFKTWRNHSTEKRADILERTADLMEEREAELLALLVREAGKTIPDAHAELREAVDFCRYYARIGREDARDAGFILPGPTGEENVYGRHGRGVFICISPWNFPLAIFTGQVAAALMAGNSVVAKPAEQTPAIAGLAVSLLHQAGVPTDVLQLILGDGFVGEKLVSHPALAGVCFTGSTEVARSINQSLAARRNGIVPLIAETGGQNAMIVDSSALPEQVVKDVVQSAFGSAGQRCSALRVLCVQQDIAPPLLRLLKGAMRELRVGNPADLSNDVGPIIDVDARSSLRSHEQNLKGFGKLIYKVPMDEALAKDGSYFAPCAYEIETIDALQGEVFGPILHVVRYKKKDLDDVIGQLNDTGFGLTLGIHSRISSFVDHVSNSVRAGNVYVNRSMIGAVVGSQPFGGQGLSGTGPKAGGVDYLRRFMTERVVSTDTTAAGGNASLVSLEE